MSHDENEMMIEYSEMTAFNFNSKEYQEVRKEVVKFKEFVGEVIWSTNTFINKIRKAEA